MKFRFGGDSINLTDGVVFSHAASSDNSKDDLNQPFLGYLHYAAPAKWQQSLRLHKRHHHNRAAQHLFGLWLFNDKIQCLKQRQIACALLAIAQRMDRGEKYESSKSAKYTVCDLAAGSRPLYHERKLTM